MYYEYWRNWLLTLLLRLILAAAVSVYGIALFMGGINQHNLVPVILGLIMNTIALVAMIIVAKTIIAPWKGSAEAYFPFYMKELESYETYKKRMGGGK